MNTSKGTHMNTRRKTVFALCAGTLINAIAKPSGAFAQQQPKPTEKIWRVGFLVPGSRPESIDASFTGGFPRGMRELGYIEGKNLVIDWRFANGDVAPLPGLAAELVQLKPDVIVSAGPPAISALQKATSTIPIVMATVVDPVGSGLVNSLARPGGNTTGNSTNIVEIASKYLELLLGMAPKLTRVAVLLNPTNNAYTALLASIGASAQKTRVTLLPVEARNPAEIEAAFASMKQDRAEAVIVQADPAFNRQVRAIAELALKQRLPSLGSFRDYTDAGCLMSYGPSFTESFRRAAYFVDRIFKGTKPADLPVEQPTKYELFINGKTAKALGLKIPQSLLIMAEKVIE